MYRFWILVLLMLVLAACSEDEPAPTEENQSRFLDSVPTFSMIGIPTPTPPPIPIAMNDSRFPIQPDPAGQVLYETHCAACHGINGEGQNPSDPYALNEDGLMMAPAHTNDGHTWHHPDQQNFVVVWLGREAPGALPMPGVSEKLTVDEVFQILAYVKTWWGEAELQGQIERTLAAAGG